LAAVIAVAKAATPPQNSRMTEKNEQRLLQLEDKSAEAQLLHLPNRLMKEARALLARRQFCMAAWTAGVAVAVEIELYCPMRLENLATLRINHELVRLDSRSEHWTHLRIAADDVKNGVPITWPIEPESAQLIETYLRDFRPLLQHSGTDWLFPSRDKASGPRQPSGLSNAISDAIYKFIGIHMNTHLFRAFAGAQILEENPGALQDLRLVLGHKTLNTALRYYTSHSSKAAAKNFSKLISRKRNETRMVAAAAFEPQRRKFGRCT
jgi:integrase